MVRVPPEVRIRATIRPGSVYYFPEDTFSSPEPHYFILLNQDPASDSVLLLVCASSRLPQVRRRRTTCPVETLVEVPRGQYKHFSVDTIVDCNQVYEKSIDQLVEKLRSGILKVKTEISMDIVSRLRAGVMASPLIERRIKLMLSE